MKMMMMNWLALLNLLVPYCSTSSKSTTKVTVNCQSISPYIQSFLYIDNIILNCTRENLFCSATGVHAKNAAFLIDIDMVEFGVILRLMI